MPVLDGLSAAEQIASARIAPVIVLTALNTGDALRAVSDLGVQEWLLKADYTSQQLTDAVQRLSIPGASRSSEQWQNVRWSEQN